MAIGTATALLGSAIIGAGASALSSSSAANKAANASQQATDANAALQREAMATQQANTAVARGAGDAAINQLMDRLGISSASSQPQAASQSFDFGAYAAANPDVVAEANKPDSFLRGATPEERIALHYQDHGKEEIAAGQRSSGQPATAQTPKQTDVQLSPGAQVPTYTRPENTVYTPQTYVRPEYDKKLDVSMEAFKNSPEYQVAQYDIAKQGGQVQASLAAQGLLNSGAALKRLQEVGQDNSVKYYGDYRDYTTGQYNVDRARYDNNYNFDTSLNSQNALAAAQLANQQFNQDRAYGTDLALANRQYETGRYDNTTNQLFNLANLGQGAASQYGNALQNSANNQGNALFSNAANQGNAALASASNLNSLIGQGMNALSYYYGNKA